MGAKKFGWERRTPEIGSMRRDGKILGWGLAGASWVALRLPCTASVEFCANGRLCVRCGTQDIGTGTYTIFAQVLHEKTGMPLDRIDVILGDSALPDGPMSGGSMVTGSVLNAIAAAATEAIKEDDCSWRPQHRGLAASRVPSRKTWSFTEGRIHRKDQTAGGDPAFRRHSEAGAPQRPQRRRQDDSRRGKIRRPRPSRCIPTARSLSKWSGSRRSPACA